MYIITKTSSKMTKNVLIYHKSLRREERKGKENEIK